MADSEQNQKPTPSIPEDQIDFGPAFRAVSRFFSGIGDAMLWLLRVVLKRWFVLFLGAVVGLGSGIGSYYMADPTYESRMTLASGNVGNRFCQERITELQQLIQEENTEQLAEELKVAPEMAGRIQSLQYKDLIAPPIIDKQDSLDARTFFRVLIRVSDYSILDQLDTKVRDYLENNEFSLRQRELTRQNLQKLITKLDDDLAQIDSLKSLMAKAMSPRPVDGEGAGFVYGEPLDPTLLYEEGIDLFEQKLNYENQLSVIDNIEIVHRFQVFKKPVFPKRKFFWGAGLLAGFGLAFLIALAQGPGRR